MVVPKKLPDGRTYHYSDSGYKIMDENGNIYDDATDQIGVVHTYTEIDELIPEEEITEIEAYNEIMDILSE